MAQKVKKEPVKKPEKNMQKKAVVMVQKKAKKPSKQTKVKVLRKDLVDSVHRTRIRVIAVGGGGGSIVAEISSRIQKFDFIAVNTDTQALKELPKKMKTVSLGQDFTHGLGCGMDADLGERIGKAEKEKLKKIIEGSDICIFIACLGGGTGSGIVPVLAEVAQELRVLSIGVFTLPFQFEGDKRKQIAEAALEKAKASINTYIVIPNENIFHIIDNKTSLKEALSAVNKQLASTLEGFMDTIASPGLINIDFADIRSVLEGKARLGYINSAEGAGVTKAQTAVANVLKNPLYTYGIAGADRILFNILGDRNLKMQEVAEVSKSISEYNPKARIIFGISCNNSRLKDRLRVTLFAVGCDPKEGGSLERKEKKRKPAAKKVKRSTGKVIRKKRSPVKKDSSSIEIKQVKEKSNAQTQEQKVRRNALDVKKAVDEELKELEQKEKEWDVPAFLRGKK